MLPPTAIAALIGGTVLSVIGLTLATFADEPSPRFVGCALLVVGILVLVGGATL